MPDGRVRVETDFYRAELDPKVRAGPSAAWWRSALAIASGLMRPMPAASMKSGYFFKDQRFYSSAEELAKVEIVESGPLRVRLRVSSQIASNSITQWLTLAQGEPRIDLGLTIDLAGPSGHRGRVSAKRRVPRGGRPQGLL